MKRMTKRKWLLLITAFLIFGIWFSYYENNVIGISKYEISSDKLPDGFVSYRIVQLSDLHSKEFGKDQSTIVGKISKLKPDLIVVTGDLVDARKYQIANGMTLMKKLTALAPVYYVNGNHEWGPGKFDSLEKKLTAAGVHVLRNTSETIKLGQGEIRLAGVDDPVFNNEYVSESEVMEDQIHAVLAGMDNADGPFTVLLSHRPEQFAVFAQNKIDLTFAGHAHGGQIRLPFIGGLFAPGQGFFPKYDGGKYIDGSSTMIVNRGLGNSIFPQRVFNRPEIVLVELTASDK